MTPGTNIATRQPHHAPAPRATKPLNKSGMTICVTPPPRLPHPAAVAFAVPTTFGANITDHQLVGGVRGGGQSNLQWNLHYRNGSNEVDYQLQGSINPSLGSLSPTNFHPGKLTQREQGAGADFVRSFNDSPLPNPGRSTAPGALYTASEVLSRQNRWCSARRLIFFAYRASFRNWSSKPGCRSMMFWRPMTSMYPK